MSAKQRRERATLYVRIPIKLKERLRMSAGQGRSLSEEVTRLLENQLMSGLAAQFQWDQAVRERDMLDTRLRMLENVILSITATDDDEARWAHVLRLRKQIEDGRVRRQQIAEEAGSGIEPPSAELEPECGAEQSRFFAGLGGQGLMQLPVQLSLSDRRLVNLRAHLKQRARGSRKRIADVLGWSSSQISQILSPPDAKGHRTITDDVAHEIEVALQLQPRELDNIETRQDDARFIEALLELEKVSRSIRETLRAVKTGDSSKA